MEKERKEEREGRSSRKVGSKGVENERKEGRKEGREEILNRMKTCGLPQETIDAIMNQER